jgi:hypothetical protein
MQCSSLGFIGFYLIEYRFLEEDTRGQGKRGKSISPSVRLLDQLPCVMSNEAHGLDIIPAPGLSSADPI